MGRLHGCCIVLAVLAGMAGEVVTAQPILLEPGRHDSTTGLHMEGPAQIERMFGNTDTYKQHIDDFYSALGQLHAQRKSAGRHTQAALIVLSTTRGCPRHQLAPLYARARASALNHSVTLKALASHRKRVQILDSLGESLGLTPDYRSKVNQMPAHHRDAKRDDRELGIAVFRQLTRELRASGCNPTRLLRTEGSRSIDEETLVETGFRSKRVATPRYLKKYAGETVAASPVNFFVDNSRCNTALAVSIDGALKGTVAAGQKAAFQSLAGRHSMCLIADGSGLQCGHPGTLRRTFIYDGFAITLHCQRDAPEQPSTSPQR